jgi:hypothetical protein
MYEYGTLKPFKVILRSGERENNGGDKPTQGTLYTYMKIHIMIIIVYNYYILRKTLKNIVLSLVPIVHFIHYLASLGFCLRLLISDNTCFSPSIATKS